MTRKGVVKERLLQIVPVTAQVVNSRKVSRFKLLLRDLQDARRVSGEGMIDPHPWRGDRVWTRSKNVERMVVGYVIRSKGGTRTASGVDR